jgi:hypothetical protein
LKCAKNSEGEIIGFAVSMVVALKCCLFHQMPVEMVWIYFSAENGAWSQDSLPLRTLI